MNSSIHQRSAETSSKLSSNMNRSQSRSPGVDMRDLVKHLAVRARRDMLPFEDASPFILTQSSVGATLDRYNWSFSVIWRRWRPDNGNSSVETYPHIIKEHIKSCQQFIASATITVTWQHKDCKGYFGAWNPRGLLETKSQVKIG